MIGSFWNLCRACPSMPVDKLHSEYRSTYRWHEYTGPRQEVVRRPPQGTAAAPSGEKANEHFNSSRVQEEDTHNELPKLEPALPRRKKHPDLAYRHHEFLVSDRNNYADQNDSSNVERARSEERGGSHWRPSRRSKSEGPARGSALVNGERRRDSDPDLEKTGRETGLLRKAISKISTEYRLQFAWPPGHTSRRDAKDSAPRKSQSMGMINPAANAIVHRKRTDFTENKDASELEPLVNDNVIREEESIMHKKEFNTEYKKKFRPFSQYEYSEGRFTKRGAPLNEEIDESRMTLINGTNTNNESWYREVVELRKKAGEYKNRGWGSELAPERLSDIYNKQIELWDQVSRRSSLSALSLASTTHRSYTKEEKDEENTKKSSPTKALRNAENSVRLMKDMIRHHLERTTGGSELDGLILSPTREKLEPTIPRKDDDSRGSQKNSPKKNSPQKSALQKRNPTTPKPKSGLRTTRSQSVGPADMTSEKRSPKRQSRSATIKEKKTPTSATESATRRPRPSSLNTTASSRSKCSSVPPEDRLAKAKSNKNQSSNEPSSKEIRKGGPGADTPKVDKTESNEAPAVAEPERIDLEPVVKSPPEPTRVKSPEQILMRSPDPVNWTVPLDTGKTFTVTQNVREEELKPLVSSKCEALKIYKNTRIADHHYRFTDLLRECDIGTRPHSEVKAWTPPEIPPPVAQSAPPELSEQSKDQARRAVDNNSDAAASLQEHSTASSSDLNPTPSVICKEEIAKAPAAEASGVLAFGVSSSGSSVFHPSTADGLDLEEIAADGLNIEERASGGLDCGAMVVDGLDSKAVVSCGLDSDTMATGGADSEEKVNGGLDLEAIAISHLDSKEIGTDGLDIRTNFGDLGATDPGITEPGITDLGVADLGLTDPGVTDPGVTDPGVIDPGVTDPSITNPGVTNPGVIDPDVRIPDVTDPGVTDPDATNPGASYTSATDIGAAEPGTTDLLHVDSGIIAVDAIDPDITDLSTIDPGTTDLGVIYPGTTDLDAIDYVTSDLGEIDPGTTDIDAIDSGTKDLGAVNPGGIKPDAKYAGATNPGATDPCTAYLVVTDPCTTDLGVIDLDATALGSTYPSTTEPGVSYNGAIVSETVASDIINLDTIASDIITSDTIASDTIASDIIASDIITSDIITSDLITSDTITSDIVPSDTITSDTITSDTKTSDTITFETIASGIEAPSTAAPSAETLSLGSRSGLIRLDDPVEAAPWKPTIYSELPHGNPCSYRILEAPPLVSPAEAGRSLASEVLEKARNRFDSFWRKNSNDDTL